MEVNIQGTKYILIEIPVRSKEDVAQLQAAQKQYKMIAQGMSYLKVDAGFWGGTHHIMIMKMLIPEQFVLHVVENVLK